MFSRDQRSHPMLSLVFMESVDMYEDFIWFPAVRCLLITSPSDQELQNSSRIRTLLGSLLIRTLLGSLLLQLFFLLGDILRINLARVEDNTGKTCIGKLSEFIGILKPNC